MSSILNRRSFLASSAAVSMGFLGLSRVGKTALAEAIASDAGSSATGVGYGPPIADPRGVFDLPDGFTYRVIARTGQEMDDGLLFGGMPDGAAAFAGPDGKTRLIVNHENRPTYALNSPFGVQNERLGQIDPALIYDRGHGRTPGLGGCSRLIYDSRTGEVLKREAAILGTERNCAGGPTPWNTWITCEETVTRAGDLAEQDHGFCFEVPAQHEGPVEPVPLTAMGRLYHEAVAVDPETSIVYLTEDRHDGCLYRFIPKEPRNLKAGGQLQALAIRETPSMDTRNWVDGEETSPHRTPVNEPLDVRWIDVENVLAPDDDLRYQSFSGGAAKFARGEGMWWGRQSVFFACTSGGKNRGGQIFRYVPSRFEGTPDEDRFPGRVELFTEPNDHDLVENADNLTVAPWGDLIVCEDAKGPDGLVGITPEGEIYRFARNSVSDSELAGACFSPDGSTLFVNIQSDGLVLAITGPWGRRGT